MINLFVNIYRDADPARDAELKECWRINAELGRQTGMSVHTLDGRPTFQQIFEAANERTGKADINIVANSDIYFDESIALLDGITFGECYALTRWEARRHEATKARSEDSTSSPSPSSPACLSAYVPSCLFSDEFGKPRIDSQDAWIWRGHCSVTGADFTPGVRGCDNHLTYLFHQAGYRVSNPSKSIRAIHLHQSGIRRYGHDAKDCVPKPYLLVAPHELGESPRLDVRF